MVGSRKRLVLNVVAVMVIMKLLYTECRDPVLHRVGGGRYGWSPETDFTEWSIHEHFYVGDWLYFGFDKKTHSVLEVNKTGYEKCIDKDFISNVTRGGRDVFNLTKAKIYYFLDGRGFCIKGMKVSVRVEEFFPPIRPLSSPPNNQRPLFPNDGYPVHVFPQMTLIATALALAFSFLL